MKLKYEFETMILDDEIFAIPFSDNAGEINGILKINDVAASILKSMKKDTTIEKIVTDLSKEYEGTSEQLTSYVMAFIEKLRKEALLSE